MQDDDQLVYRDDATRDATLAQMRAEGVDYVRVTVLWRVVANGAASTPARKRRFRPADPASYPSRNWNRYDNLARSAQRLGIGVYFNLTGPGPDFSHARAPARLRKNVQDTWMPNASQFYKFVTAVGRRYSGSYRAGGQTVPRVSVWSIWNEPNQGGWITPQWRSVGGRLIPYSPILYRKLFFDGRLALAQTGHGNDTILIGETAPVGVARRTATSAMDPRTFIRELFCADGSGQPYSGAAASARGCSIFSQFGRFAVSGWAHHPYTKFLPPTTVDPSPGALTMANISALGTLLDQLSNTTHRISSGLPIVSSEFGFETKPPDPYNGIPLEKQAEYDNLGDLLAWANPRVTGQTQFLQRDAPPLRNKPRGSRAYWSTYQSGLLFANGSAKPAFAAYLLPAVVTPGPADAAGVPQLAIWGQLRFLAHSPLGQRAQNVQVEYHPGNAPAGAYTPLGAPIAVTDTVRHFFGALIPDPGAGSLRLHWSGQGVVADRYSRAITLAG